MSSESNKEIKFILEVGHWFDEENGNTYSAGNIIDLKRNRVKLFKFQYGSPRHIEDLSLRFLTKEGKIEDIYLYPSVYIFEREFSSEDDLKLSFTE